MAMHACRKHRINQVFARPEAERIDRAIRHVVHPVMSEATLLIKHRLLEETVALGAAGRNVAPLVLDVDDVDRAVGVILGGVKVRKSRGLAEGENDAEHTLRLAQAEAWDESYSRMRQKTFRAGEETVSKPLSDRADDISISGVLRNASRMYVACLLTNVRYHYSDYVRRSVGQAFRARVASLEGVAQFDDLSKARKLAWGRLFRVAHDDLFLFREGPEMKADDRIRDIVERLRPRLVPSKRPGARTVDEDLCNAGRCFVYLGYMVRMTMAMQANKEHRLPSPIPLKTSFIPAHYSLDTGSLCHLLFDNTGQRKTLKKFSRYFEHSIRGGFPLPGLKNMADVCSSIQKLSGPGRNATTEDEQLYMDALWTYLGRFNSRKAMKLCPLFQVTQRKMARQAGTPMMLFDHSVCTDGYSVSLSMSNASVRGRHAFLPTCRNSAMKKPKVGGHIVNDSNGVPIEAATGFPILTSATAAYWAGQFEHDLKGSCKAGGDPGKGVILQLVGQVDGKTEKLRYTSKQRKFETGGVQKSQRLIRARAKKLEDVMPCHQGASIEARIETIEKGVLRTCSPRAASLPAFREYVRKRDAVRAVLETLYSQKVFRWARFLAWMKRDASVGRFVKTIVEKFGRGGRPVVIFYGDWGRNPNLKNQAPTPGIGLRRLLHTTLGIQTVTVRETYTSSYCPCCSSTAEKARGAHGLLRCENHGGCGRYWARDILGATNILAKAMYLMAHPGQSHPLFMG